MSDSSNDPDINDGDRRTEGAPPDVPALQTRLTREFGVRHPFVGAGMGFIAHQQLAAAVTNAGGLGVLGASPDPADSLVVMVERLRALTSGPFGVDLICADTWLGPASTDKHIDACVQLDLPLVVFHHDPPPARWVTTLRRTIGMVAGMGLPAAAVRRRGGRSAGERILAATETSWAGAAFLASQDMTAPSGPSPVTNADFPVQGARVSPDRSLAPSRTNNPWTQLFWRRWRPHGSLTRPDLSRPRSRAPHARRAATQNGPGGALRCGALIKDRWS